MCIIFIRCRSQFHQIDGSNGKIRSLPFYTITGLWMRDALSDHVIDTAGSAVLLRIIFTALFMALAYCIPLLLSLLCGANYSACLLRHICCAVFALLCFTVCLHRQRKPGWITEQVASTMPSTTQSAWSSASKVSRCLRYCRIINGGGFSEKAGDIFSKSS